MSFPLDSRQLRTFLGLAEKGSFTHAARSLSLTQSAVSHAIKALEEEVGCRLFDRLGRKVHLTQAGEQLLRSAQKISAEMEMARGELKELGRWGRGRLRVGATLTACQYLLPEVLREFRESFAQSVITIEPGDTPMLVWLLESNKIDLAVGLDFSRDDRYLKRDLFTDDLQFLVSPLHPWAVTGKVRLEEIMQQNFILYSKTSETFRLIQTYFARQNISLPSVMELGSIEAIKKMVKLGLGISVLAPWVAQLEIAEGSLIRLPLGKKPLPRRWVLSHAKLRRLTLAEETFAGLCRAFCQKLVHESSVSPTDFANESAT